MELIKINEIITNETNTEVTINDTSVTGETSNLKILIEPGTVTVILQVLASMAKKFFEDQREEEGNKKLQGLFDQLGDRFAQIVQQAVEEIKKFTLDALDDTVIREAQSQLDAVKSHLIAYEKAPTEANYRLEEADKSATYVFYLMQKYDLKGLLIYSQAVSLRLLVHAVRYKAFGDKGELSIPHDIVNVAVPYVTDLSNKALQVWDAKISGVTNIEFWSVFHRGSRLADIESYTEHFARFYDNGQELKLSKRSSDEASQQITQWRNAAIEKYSNLRQDTFQAVFTPISIAVKEWHDFLDTID